MLLQFTGTSFALMPIIGVGKLLFVGMGIVSSGKLYQNM